MFSRKVTVRNRAGIHVRPSTLILNAVRGYGGKILLKAKGIESELNKPAAALDLLAMGLGCGETAELSVSGPDEENFGKELSDLFEKHFDFPPREE